MASGNEELDLGNGIIYIYYPLHRNKNPEKSQWIITNLEELNCFKNGHQRCQILLGHGHTYWGIHLENGEICYLGEATANSKSDKLFIAKFVDSAQNNKWHGYPADHVDKYPEDVANERVLLYWQSQGILRKSKISKILKGQKCNL